jgi:hypothetical protein
MIDFLPHFAAWEQAEVCRAAVCDAHADNSLRNPSRFWYFDDRQSQPDPEGRGSRRPGSPGELTAAASFHLTLHDVLHFVPLAGQ